MFKLSLMYIITNIYPHPLIQQHSYCAHFVINSKERVRTFSQDSSDPRSLYSAFLRQASGPLSTTLLLKDVRRYLPQCFCKCRTASPSSLLYSTPCHSGHSHVTFPNRTPLTTPPMPLLFFICSQYFSRAEIFCVLVYCLSPTEK